MSSTVSIPELPRRRDSEESLLLDSRISKFHQLGSSKCSHFLMINELGSSKDSELVRKDSNL